MLGLCLVFSVATCCVQSMMSESLYILFLVTDIINITGFNIITITFGAKSIYYMWLVLACIFAFSFYSSLPFQIASKIITTSQNKISIDTLLYTRHGVITSNKL